jgi:MoaA/NifB/PqqE/SkfB family radical SAM enzyme
LHKGLLKLVELSKSLGIEKIAVSSNGYSNLDLYIRLINAGVNDFSISLDACCAEKVDEMAGGIKGAFSKITNNIRELSKLTYVTVGVVLTQDNIDSLNDTISFASSLGVSDIRIILAAQEGDRLKTVKVSDKLLSKHPILAYRVKNIQNGLPIRGIGNNDYNRCGIVLDDVAVVDGYHYPCIIAFREGAPPIGKLVGNWRHDRLNWFLNTNTHKNNICKSNCLDCLVKTNNIFASSNKKYGSNLHSKFDKTYHLPLVK